MRIRSANSRSARRAGNFFWRDTEKRFDTSRANPVRLATSRIVFGPKLSPQGLEPVRFTVFPAGTRPERRGLAMERVQIGQKSSIRYGFFKRETDVEKRTRIFAAGRNTRPAQRIKIFAPGAGAAQISVFPVDSLRIARRRENRVGFRTKARRRSRDPPSFSGFHRSLLSQARR